ncbi:MAG: hypothetical protein ACRD8O_11040, partial [Bryobacteraceae bacterium]
MRASETALIIGATAVFLLFEAQGFPPRYEWSLKPSHRDGMVHFTITRAAEGNHWRHGTDVPLSAFSGLPIDRLGNLHTAAKFEYVRDAGRLLCEGSFNLGRGSGTFTFSPNPAFTGELEKLGYTRPTGDQVFKMMMNDVTLEFARFVRDSGLRANTRDLIDLRVHGVKPEYIQEARNLGFADFDARNFIELKIHGVTTELLRELKRVGYNFSAKDITELKIHGVTPDLIAALKSASYDLSAREITELKIHG